ncbi:hypothetical protein A2U01_0065436, partial [Trifolium medium]|nr:hypothetical protein [Trifolium medium]
ATYAVNVYVITTDGVNEGSGNLTYVIQFQGSI